MQVLQGKIFTLTMHKNYVRQLQKRTAEDALSAAALRNQGAKGVTQATRDALAKINLREFPRLGVGHFRIALDSGTDGVRPIHGNHRES